MNISGIVVSVSPKYFQEVLANLNKSQLCEVHFDNNETTIIVTIEDESVGAETEKLREIQSMDHIISAEMSYSYNEDELELLRQDVEMKQGTVPDFLKDDNAKAEDAHYGGDINKQLKN